MNMKKRLLFLVFMLVLPIVYSQDWVFDAGEANLELHISGGIDIIPKSSDYRVQYVIANLSFIPQDGFQEKVLSVETKPSASIKDGYAIFRWDKPNKLNLDFSLDSNLKTFNMIIEVKSKVNFPLKDLPDDVRIYTQPSETIDSENEAIVRMASKLVEGEDDLYVIAFKLGDWTKRNIEYNLSTLTEGVSQSASWVLKNKEGVCDELTNLFIAMNRALGIPAKFISGVAYTNAEGFGEGFGPHGWAEVYFPGYGWIPFDVTYGEFGFIDAGHIKLKESVDANDASTRFQWLGYEVDIKSSKLDINVDVIDKKSHVGEYIGIEANAANDNIDFGSYNLIEATVKNLKDYYVAVHLRLSKSKETEVVGEDEKSLLLGPGEEKKVNWIVGVSADLEGGYVYTFPFVISSLRNVSSKVSFDAREDGKEYSLERIESLIEYIGGENKKGYLGNVDLNCKLDKDNFYEYENTTVRCNIKNMGNVYLEDLSVCLEENCDTINLGITQEKGLSFDFKPSEAGSQEIAVRANSGAVSKSAFLDVTVYDKPLIEILNLVYPGEVRYKDLYEVSFLLDKKSKFAPNNVSIAVSPMDKEWEINQLSEDRQITLKMYGNELKAGSNSFNIFVKYEDKNGNEYEAKQEFEIRLVDVNLFQHVMIFFKSISRGVLRMFK